MGDTQWKQVVVLGLFLVCLAVPGAAAERGDDETMIRSVIARFWSALGRGEAGVLKEVVRSPFTLIGIAAGEAGGEHVITQSADAFAADVVSGGGVKAEPSGIEVHQLSRNAAYATYSVAVEGKSIPIVTMLAVDGVWRIVSTGMPAQSGVLSRAQFTVNPMRFDPYKNFKFRVKWDGRYVAGVSKVSGLRRNTEVVEQRDAGSPNTVRRSPGRTRYEPIVLERGLTHDAEFEKWADKVWDLGAGLGAETSLKDFRKDVIIEVYNEAGQLALAYKVYRCWVSQYQALPEMDANGDAVAIEQITLAHEGWERDTAVTEPVEPTTGRGPAAPAK